MSKSNMSDSQADGVAAIIIVVVVIATLYLWLGTMPA